MTKHNYRSSTGLYSIRLGPDLIHEGITSTVAAELIRYYMKRYESGLVAWPYNPDRLRVEHFSGVLKLKPKK